MLIMIVSIYLEAGQLTQALERHQALYVSRPQLCVELSPAGRWTYLRGPQV